MLRAKIFASAGGVLANQRYLAHARGGRALGFGNHRFKPPRAKLTTQLRNNAKGARMIAALSDFDVRGVSGCSQHARRGFVVKIIGEVGNRAVPVLAGEAPLSRSKIAFRSRLQNLER